MKRPGEPNFSISSPSADDELTPNFSVYGTCPEGTANIEVTVTVQTDPPTPSQSSGTISPATPTAWEAVFSNVPAGPATITATSTAGETGPINVTIVWSPGPADIKSVDGPPPAEAAADRGGNPWAGWRVTGTYHPNQVGFIQVYLTQAGSPVIQPLAAAPAAPIMAPAVLHPASKKWNVNLGFVPGSYAGTGFNVHFRALRSDNGPTLRGSLGSFFTGPPAPTDG